MRALAIKPTHNSIAAYYDALGKVHAFDVTSEGSTEFAFSHLLAPFANSHGWTLITKRPVKLGGGKSIIPDGTRLDPYSNWWAAKAWPTLQNRLSQGGPSLRGPPVSLPARQHHRRRHTAIILFQSCKEHVRYDLTKSQQVADLLNQFYACNEPNIEDFEQYFRDGSGRQHRQVGGRHF